jgi:hypothetical protein
MLDDGQDGGGGVVGMDEREHRTAVAMTGTLPARSWRVKPPSGA